MWMRSVTLLLLLAGASQAAPNPALDQEFVPSPISSIAYIYRTFNDSLNQDINVDWAQTFQVGKEGTLTAVELFAYRVADSVTEPLLFDIRTTSAGVPTTPDVGANILFSSSIDRAHIGTSESTVLHIDLDSGAIPVVVGDVLTLTLRSSDRTLGAYRWNGNSSGTYAGGKAFVRSTDAWDASGGGSQDLGFRTYVTPIPEPGALTLLGLGSLVFALQKRLGKVPWTVPERPVAPWKERGAWFFS